MFEHHMLTSSGLGTCYCPFVLFLAMLSAVQGVFCKTGPALTPMGLTKLLKNNNKPLKSVCLSV